MFKAIFLLVLFLSAPVHGKIKTLHLDGSKMGTVNLAMGRSTVLRFEDTPVKIVLGNKHHFNFEFVGNDVTLQPLAEIGSNLFVYGKKRTYGFTLNFLPSGRYDDLVRVFYRPPPQVAKPVTRKDRRHLSSFRVGQALKVVFSPVKRSPLGRKVLILDLLILNLTGKGIATGEIRVGINAREQRAVFERDTLPVGGRVRARVFFQGPGKKIFLSVRLGRFKTTREALWAY